MSGLRLGARVLAGHGFASRDQLARKKPPDFLPDLPCLDYAWTALDMVVGPAPRRARVPMSAKGQKRTGRHVAEDIGSASDVRLHLVNQ
jgi:hypothetical protein